ERRGPDGTQRLRITFGQINLNGTSIGNAVTADAAGNLYVAGSTTGPVMAGTSHYPIVNAVQPQYGGGVTDATLTKFAPDGHILFSTYLGGNGNDVATNLALDAQGLIVVAGTTTSTDFLSSAHQDGPGGGQD